QPLMPYIDSKAPKKPRKVKLTGQGILTWASPKAKREMDKARQYAIYKFAAGEKINLESSSNLFLITSQLSCQLPSAERGTVYVVTALDRLHNESKPVKVKVK
ncbi:MAG: hypothetical protein II275_11765, partial [Bacteroidaceae bacterium]|nr:hypothetical protein [Bacteroidaceae bacterium]